MPNPPYIKVINENGVGAKTKIMYGDTDISNSISEIDVRIRVGEINRATLTALAVNGELTAEVAELKTKVVPPPLPVAELTFTIHAPKRRFGRLRSRWTLVLSRPLGDNGRSFETLREGWGPPKAASTLRFVQE